MNDVQSSDARRPHFVGSTEHKNRPSRWGPPTLPCGKALCRPHIGDDEVERVLVIAFARAIERGACSRARENGWPRYLWGRDSFRTLSHGVLTEVWEARLTNRESGWYKAYPVTLEAHALEMPHHVRRSLWH